MSPRRDRYVFAACTAAIGLLALACAAPLLASPLPAQYPGRTDKAAAKAPVLRSIAVLEWTGDPGKPSASRLIPVAVFDGNQLNDGNIYLNRPQPLALDSGTEYELQQKGTPIGRFDLVQAGEQDGTWRGYGAWKPLNAAAQAAAKAAVNTSSLYASAPVADDDHPVLHRKHPKGTDSDETPAAPKSDPAADSSADPDRPSLHKKNADPTSASGDGSGSVDPERPTLHRKTTISDPAADSGTSTAAPDPDRPTLHRTHKSTADEAGMAETSLATPDPDRPRLKRGKPAGLDSAEAPKLDGLPATLQQAVAVSDAATHPDHPWRYSWADPADEDKMRSSLLDIARHELGLDPPAAPAKPARPARNTAAHRKPAPTPPAPDPVELADVRFQVFELAFGSPATMVLAAATPADRDAPADPAAAPAPRKHITLIAQPDLYGGILVIHKNLTDERHLDQTPQMRLVDAVDAMGDNRAELLFELRSDGQRQFALYRVTRGKAEQIFTTVAIP